MILACGIVRNAGIPHRHSNASSRCMSVSEVDALVVASTVADNEISEREYDRRIVKGRMLVSAEEAFVIIEEAAC